MFRSLASVFVILNAMALVSPILALVSNRFAPAAPNATTSALHGHHWLKKRQNFSPVTTCGYLDGDPESPRTADGGYGCRVDTANGLWGFCPTTVISAKDCGLAGFCVDNNSCTAGCGRLFDRTDITTFTCESAQLCSTVLLVNGPDQQYEYIACGRNAGTETLRAVPNAVEASTTSNSIATPSSSLVRSISQPTSSDAISSAPIRSSPSISSESKSSPSSTSGLTDAPSEQKSTNIGAIVGGIIGGLTVICLTILGILLIRRKRGATEKTAQPPGYTYNDRFGSTNDNAYSTHDPACAHKYFQWDSSHGPVEMHGGHTINTEPAELMAKP